jgi:hypothetical protein
MQVSFNPTDIIWQSPWPGAIAWSLIYITDYSLTLSCARMYQGTANQTFVLEGSYELNPVFEADIDSLKSWSPRFIAALIASVALLISIWWLSSVSEPGLYRFALGSMICMELAIHTRHLRNLFLFRAIVSRSDLVRGRIEYARLLSLRMSSNEMLSFSAVFGILCIFTPSWFLLGGATACLCLSVNHRKLARAHAKRHEPGTGRNLPKLK